MVAILIKRSAIAYPRHSLRSWGRLSLVRQSAWILRVGHGVATPHHSAPLLVMMGIGTFLPVRFLANPIAQLNSSELATALMSLASFFDHYYSSGKNISSMAC
jgi:hypothetical protein